MKSSESSGASTDFDTPQKFKSSNLSWWEDVQCVFYSIQDYAEMGVLLHRTHGFVYRQRLPTPSIALAHPRHLHRVLKGNAANYVKSADYDFLRPLLGGGIFVSDGELWTRQRRLMAPEFRSVVVPRFVPVIVDSVESLFREWDQQPERDFSSDMMRLTIWIVGAALFHQEFRQESEQIGHALEVCLAQGTLQMVSMGLLQSWMPTPGNREAQRQEEILNRIVLELIQRNRENPGPGMLSRLLTAKDEDTGAGMSQQQLIDEVKSLILAGHETTSLALSWAFYLLSSHPEAAERLREEADRVLGGRHPTAEDFPKLEYARMVFLETMRLYPPVPVVTRQAKEADHFDGIDVAAGEKVVVSLYTTQRHPDFWTDPEAFDPERFSPAREPSIQPYSYLPFLLGRRACLGEHFAMLEGVLALAMMAGRYTVTRLDNDVIATRPISTLRLARPLRVRVQKRG